MRISRILFTAVVGLLALLTTTHAQGTSPKRAKIDPFQVSLEPLDYVLSYQEGLLVRYHVEQVLSNYLMNVYVWPPTLTVVFVAVARVLSNGAIFGSDGAVMGARLTFDGLIYFSDDSTNIPTSSELRTAIADALNPETLVTALQQQFPSVSSVAIEQSLTPWPTESPTLAPIIASTPAPTTLTTKVATSIPTIASTDYPTLTPTLTPTTLEPSTREPTSMSLTAVPVEMTSSPTMEPTEEELPATAEPTTRETPSPTTPSPTLNTPMPTSTTGTASPTVAPTAFPTVLPTVLPTMLSPVLSPVLPTGIPTESPTVATRGPQDVSEVIDEPKLVANKDTNPATIAGAVTASLLLVLILSVLLTRRGKAREDENPETTDDILNDLKETEARTEPAPTQTFSPSSGGGNPDEEYDEERSPKGLGFLKYFGAKQQVHEDPPHLAMTDGSDAGESDGSELRSDGEQTSLAELYRGWWPRPSTAAASAASVSSSGASAMVNSVESFERRKVDNHLIRKDILESPDLSAATLSQYKTSQALRASMVNEEEYDCALAPTDISAASLALKPRADEGGGEDVEQVLKPSFSEESSNESRNKTGNERDEEGDMLSSGLAALFNSWWGASKPSRHGSLLTDDDTFGGQGDWDPDDETRTSDEHSMHSKVDGEEQSSLLDTTKNATYQMQRLRTPPEGLGARPRPIAAPVGPRELTTPSKSNMKSPPRTPITSRAPGSPHPILHHEVGEPTEDVYDL